MAIQSDAYDLILCQVHPLAFVKQSIAVQSKGMRRANKANIIEVVW